MAYATQTHCKNGHEYTEDNVYWSYRKGPDKYLRQCKECINAQNRAAYAPLTAEQRAERRKSFPSRAKMKHYQRKYKYGITEDEVRALVQRQGGTCGICSRVIRVDATEWDDQVHIDHDHDHDTGEVRGALCRRCNAGIGFLMEDITTMKRALAYVQMSRFAKGVA